MAVITIDPVTRVSGLLNIQVEITDGKITNAKCSGSQFRGFEQMFKGRNPLDIIRLAPRICGICSTHHTMASVLALEEALKVVPDYNGKLVRDIANGFEFIQNYIRHLCIFVLPDYVNIGNVNPLYKTESAKDADYRLDESTTSKINEDYVSAVAYSRKAHEAIAELTAKAPHCHGIFVGGTTTNINVNQIEKVKYLIKTISEFVKGPLIEDINIIAKAYGEYYNMGKGYGNLMCYGLFEGYEGIPNYTVPSVMINGVVEDFDSNNINEAVTYSWLQNVSSDDSQVYIPGKDFPAVPNAYKEGGYSWVVAPRYKGVPMEVGALARMKLNGSYSGGISVMDRLMAKALEAIKMCDIVSALIDRLTIKEAFQKQWQIPQSASGKGLIEAERGALGHWITIENSTTSNYSIIPPSAWNFSPEDNKGVKGTVEAALIGTEIKDINHPVEVGRIVRSFDPCLNCAAHIVADKGSPFHIIIA